MHCSKKFLRMFTNKKDFYRLIPESFRKVFPEISFDPDLLFKFDNKHTISLFKEEEI